MKPVAVNIDISLYTSITFLVQFDCLFLLK